MSDLVDSVFASLELPGHAVAEEVSALPMMPPAGSVVAERAPIDPPLAFGVADGLSLPSADGFVVAWESLHLADVLAAAHRYELHRRGMELPGQGEWRYAANGSMPAEGDVSPARFGNQLPDDILAPSVPVSDGDGLPVSAVGGHVMIPPGPALAGWLACTRRRELDDAALVTTITGWRKLTSWAQAQELAAVAELARRRGVPGAAPWTEGPGEPDTRSTGAPASTDAESPGEAGSEARLAELRQELAAEFAPNEVALALTLTRHGAEYWMDLGVSLASRLPRTLAALSEGKIDLSRARLVEQYTGPLSNDLAHRVEDKVLGKAERQTSGQLRAALQRAVFSVDPAAAERRRLEAEKNARVELFGDDEGTASLGGRFLPAAQATAAWARICAMAKAMQGAGAAGGADLLRAKVFVGLLLGTLPLIPPPQVEPGDGQPSGPGHGFSPQGYIDGRRPGAESGPDREGPDREGPDRDGPDDDEPGEGGRADRGPREGGPGGGGGPGVPAPGEGTDPGAGKAARSGESSRDKRPEESPGHASPSDWPPIPGPGHVPAPGCAKGWPGSSLAASAQAAGQPPSSRRRGRAAASQAAHDEAGRPGRDGRAALTVPWRTLAGLACEPGALSRIGPVTGEVARGLAAIAAADVACQWRLILVGRAGKALAVTTLPRTWLTRDRLSPASAPSGSGPPGTWDSAAAPTMMARVTLTVPVAVLDELGENAHGEVGWAGPAELRPVLAAALRAGSRARQRLHAAELSGERPSGERPSGERPSGERPSGERPSGEQPSGEQPSGEQPSGERPSGERLGGPCSHRDAVPAYRVPGWMRALIEARDQTCRFPCCRQPAWHCDQDHTLAYERGGSTCPCNLGAACRHHHQLKQQPEWLLTQARPGVLTWRTPAGLTYTVTPEPHPG